MPQGQQAVAGIRRAVTQIASVAKTVKAVSRLQEIKAKVAEDVISHTGTAAAKLAIQERANAMGTAGVQQSVVEPPKAAQTVQAAARRRGKTTTRSPNASVGTVSAVRTVKTTNHLQGKEARNDAKRAPPAAQTVKSAVQAPKVSNQTVRTTKPSISLIGKQTVRARARTIPKKSAGQVSKDSNGDVQNKTSAAIKKRPSTAAAVPMQPTKTTTTKAQPNTKTSSILQQSTTKATVAQPNAGTASATQQGTTTTATIQPGITATTITQPKTKTTASAQPGATNIATSEPGTTTTATTPPNSVAKSVAITTAGRVPGKFVVPVQASPHPGQTVQVPTSSKQTQGDAKTNARNIPRKMTAPSPPKAPASRAQGRVGAQTAEPKASAGLVHTKTVLPHLTQTGARRVKNKAKRSPKEKAKDLLRKKAKRSPNKTKKGPTQEETTRPSLETKSGLRETKVKGPSQRKVPQSVQDAKTRGSLTGKETSRSKKRRHTSLILRSLAQRLAKSRLSLASSPPTKSPRQKARRRVRAELSGSRLPSAFKVPGLGSLKAFGRRRR